jgi:hypothetical protein
MKAASVYDVEMADGGEAEEILRDNSTDLMVEKVIGFLLEHRATIATVITIPTAVRAGYPMYAKVMGHPETVRIRDRLRKEKGFRAALYEAVSRHERFGPIWARKLFTALES